MFKKLYFVFLICVPVLISAQSVMLKAMVGGTLIDGYGSDPIKNSVIIIEGELITAVGTIETLSIPENAEIISTEGMTVLPGLWDMHVHTMINGHADYGYWDRTYPPLFKDVIMPASAEQLIKEKYLVLLFMYQDHLSKKSHIREQRILDGV